MTIEIPRGFVEELLLGSLGEDQRQLQDSPILADVWLAFAREPDSQVHLLITPNRDSVASLVARTLGDHIKRSKDDPNIAFLQGIVAATLYLDELLRVVVPMTEWWQSSRIQSELQLYRDREEGLEKLNRAINAILTAAKYWGVKSSTRESERDRLSAFDRYVALAGLLLWAGGTRSRKRADAPQMSFADAIPKVQVQTIADLLIKYFDAIREGPQDEKLVFQIALNRRAF